jgi:hypothetical protein
MKRLLPYGCPIVAALLVIFVAPPPKLVTLIGSETWARLGLWVLVTVVLFMGLIGLGLSAGKVGLPFGLSLEHAPVLGGPAIEALAADLKALREADERIFERLGRLAELLERTVQRTTLVEERVDALSRPPDDGALSR